MDKDRQASPAARSGRADCRRSTGSLIPPRTTRTPPRRPPPWFGCERGAIVKSLVNTDEAVAVHLWDTGLQRPGYVVFSAVVRASPSVKALIARSVCLLCYFSKPAILQAVLHKEHYRA